MAQWRRLLGSQKWQRPGGGGGGGERLPFAGARPISDGGGGGERERERNGTVARLRRTAGERCGQVRNGKSAQRHSDRTIQ